MNNAPTVAILGIFVADLAFRASRLPNIGETLIGNSFATGPGGKGANQAVAAARAGASVCFISRVGRDAFGDGALDAWRREGIEARVEQLDDVGTGAAFIFVDSGSGDNAIIVVPGAAGTIDAAFVDARADAIRNARVFVTQLEQPVDAARRGLEIARAAGVTTVFNPAPAAALPDDVYPLCDFVTPNESETEYLTGLPAGDVDQARRAAEALLDKGVGTALITLGERGALLHNRDRSELIPAFDAGPVHETTGAGDAFNGGFAAALARGAAPAEAARFGCAVAAISVTRAGTAPSMPHLDDIRALLADA